MEYSVPIPLEPSPPPEKDERKLWIGNLDPRATEYSVIKLLKRFGVVEHFDYLFHKSGPQKGMPRGYCFATFETASQAERAMKALDGYNLGGRNISVRRATAVTHELLGPPTKICPKPAPPPKPEVPKSVQGQIAAIEAKLREMERSSERDLVQTLAAPPPPKVIVTTKSADPGPSRLRNPSQFSRSARSRPYYRHGRR